MAAAAVGLPMAAVALGLLAAPAARALDFGVEGGLAYAFGPMGGADGLVGSRSTQTLSLHAFPHLNLPVAAPGHPFQLKPGLLLEYGETRQFADPGGDARFDVRGNGYLLGLGLEAHAGPVSLLFGLHFLGALSIPSVVAGRSDIGFSHPTGFVAEAAYDIFPRFAAELRFRQESFGHSHYTDGGTVDVDSDLSSGFTQDLIGLGGRLSF